MKYWIVGFAVAAALLFPLQAGAQAGAIQPAMLGAAMPDFSLPAFQGGVIRLSQFKGKNLLLIFPRGRVKENHWCQICHYQYAELAELEGAQQLREKYNLEIVYVLPYSQALVEEWVARFPEQMAIIEGWKNPPNPDKLDANGRKWMEMTRRVFPKSFAFKPGEVPTPFPILIDAERVVSKRLGLFTTEWDHTKVEQNIPMVLIIDHEGIVRFKYISQNTFDRPESGYLFKFLERMVISK